MTNPDTTNYTIATATSKGWTSPEDSDSADFELAIKFLSNLPTEKDQDKKEEKMRRGDEVMRK